jgi:REP element-mobilizing transposase RayT
MGRLPRSALPDGFFHVYCRGVAAGVAFPSGDDRTEFLRLLGRSVRRHGWELHAACVLSTHYHLVLEARVEALSKGLHDLNWRYARYFNKRYALFGHVFSERFQTRALEGEDRVFETCAYVLLNPVKARLCQRVEQWPWSYSRYGLAVS